MWIQYFYEIFTIFTLDRFAKIRHFRKPLRHKHILCTVCVIFFLLFHAQITKTIKKMMNYINGTFQFTIDFIWFVLILVVAFVDLHIWNEKWVSKRKTYCLVGGYAKWVSKVSVVVIVICFLQSKEVHVHKPKNELKATFDTLCKCIWFMLYFLYGVCNVSILYICTVALFIMFMFDLFNLGIQLYNSKRNTSIKFSIYWYPHLYHYCYRVTLWVCVFLLKKLYMLWACHYKYKLLCGYSGWLKKAFIGNMAHWITCVCHQPRL